MAPQSFTRVASSTPTHSTAKVQKKISNTEYVKKYTEYLVRGHQQAYALDRLLNVTCPLKVFEECLTEEVVYKHCSHKMELQFPMTLFIRKLASLRETEFSRAKERLDKNGKMTVDYTFQIDFIRMQKEKLDQVEPEATNRLFADAFRRVQVTAKPIKSRPDYSKFKIVKRSKTSAPTEFLSSGSPKSI